jgi:hypothetical protein
LRPGLSAWWNVVEFDRIPDAAGILANSTTVRLETYFSNDAYAGIATGFFIDNPFVTGVCLPVDGGRSVDAPAAIARQAPERAD